MARLHEYEIKSINQTEVATRVDVLISLAHIAQANEGNVINMTVRIPRNDNLTLAELRKKVVQEVKQSLHDAATLCEKHLPLDGAKFIDKVGKS